MLVPLRPSLLPVLTGDDLADSTAGHSPERLRGPACLLHGDPRRGQGDAAVQPAAGRGAAAPLQVHARGVVSEAVHDGAGCFRGSAPRRRDRFGFPARGFVFDTRPPRVKQNNSTQSQTDSPRYASCATRPSTRATRGHGACPGVARSPLYTYSARALLYICAVFSRTLGLVFFLVSVLKCILAIYNTTKSLT